MSRDLDKTQRGIKAKPQLSRTTIATSRLMDFCSEKELVAQTGHPKEAWSLVILKELMDNALDACEDKSITPVIDVEVTESGIEVKDNGAGIPVRTIQRILDFSVRVSSREAYVAPDRGAQGNALKTLIMMPFVLSGNKAGKVEITSKGVRHTINIKVDDIRQKPIIEHTKAKSTKFVKTGSSIQLCIPGCFVKETKQRFLQIADDYTFLNPHLMLNINWMGEQKRTEAIDKGWAKWRPNEPTSAHWYEPEHFTRLLGAYIALDEDRGKDRTVREVVAEFRGLSSTAKQKVVLESTGLARVNLSALKRNKTVNRKKAGSLLAAMKKHTKPVKPIALGIIGRDNLAKKFETNGCDMKTFDYCKILNMSDEGLPFVIETAFGWFGENSKTPRRIITGVNWSVGIINPFRELGTFGQSLDSILEQQRIGRSEPVVFLLHCAYPRVEYTDRGKSAVVIHGKSDEKSNDDSEYGSSGGTIPTIPKGERKAEKDNHEPEKVKDSEPEKKRESMDIKLLKEWQGVGGETFEVGATITVTPASVARQLIADGIAVCDEKAAKKTLEEATSLFDDLVFGGKSFNNTFMKALTSGDSRKVDKVLDRTFNKMMKDFRGMKK